MNAYRLFLVPAKGPGEGLPVYSYGDTLADAVARGVQAMAADKSGLWHGWCLDVPRDAVAQ